MNRYIPLTIVAVVGAGTLAGGTLLYRAKRPVTTVLTAEQLAVARDSGGAAHGRGNPDAPVTLEEFGDLECPPCAALSDPLNQIVKDHRGGVRVVFREFPLATHAHAYQAALAAEAAGLQGRFWPMHDLLYREQATWDQLADPRSLFESFAGTLGMDVDRYKKDRDGGEAKARVTGDQRRGDQLGVTDTPTIFADGTQVPRDSLRPERLRAFVDAVVKSHPGTR